MNGKTTEPPSSTCPACGGNNHCTKDEHCWCMKKPQRLPLPATGACRCERCFDRLAGESREKSAG